MAGDFVNDISKWLCRCGAVLIFVYAIHEICSGRDNAIDIFLGFGLSVAIIGGLDLDD